MAISKGYDTTAVPNFREMLGRLLSQTNHDVSVSCGIKKKYVKE